MGHVRGHDEGEVKMTETQRESSTDEDGGAEDGELLPQLVAHLPYVA